MAPNNADRITKQLMDDTHDAITEAQNALDRAQRLLGLLTHYNVTQDVGGEG